MFHNFFNSLERSRYLSLFSHSFSFILWSAGTANSTILQIFFFFFFVDYYKVWFSGRDYVIRLYIKVPLEFVRVIFLDRCWIVHIPFVGMVKLKFLAHFPVDHFAQAVASSPVLLLCQFAAFAYYVTDGLFQLCHRIVCTCYFIIIIIIIIIIISFLASLSQ